METSLPPSEQTSGTSPAADPPRPGIAPVLAMFIAPWALAVSNGAYAWATRAGGGDSTGAEALALAEAHPGLIRLSTVAALLGCLLMVPAVVGARRLLVGRGRKLGSVGALLMGAGYICYFGIAFAGNVTLAMVEHPGNAADYAAVIDGSQSDPSTLWVFLLFVLGNLVGTLLLGVAFLRGRVVPVWAGAAVIAWPVLHVAGLVVGSEWFEVAGACLEGVGLAVAGTRVLAARR
ncbi:hypothetical protein [Microtetraspora malaysiensis]|uniref:hypothetical protein n=1 Tax=Microtetraspora malaysiensis TaxID=161358 RepID=UPI00082A5540|nr:hypothetical protein [Microtetraspora malaysiensis]